MYSYAYETSLTQKLPEKFLIFRNYLGKVSVFVAEYLPLVVEQGQVVEQVQVVEHHQVVEEGLK